MKGITALGLTALLLMAGTSAQAEPPTGKGHGDMKSHSGMMKDHGKHHGKGYGDKHRLKPHNAAVHFLHMGRMLELSDSQRQELRDLRDQYIKNNSVAEDQLKAARHDLKAALYADEIDKRGTKDLLKRIGKLEGQLWEAFVDQLAAIKGLLTAEQKESLAEMHGGDDRKRGHHGDKKMMQ